jgi:arylsulfatase
MARDDQQHNSQPKQTRDGWPVRQGIGVMPGGPDTYIAYGKAWANVSNTPFREYKHWTHEGGISTPLIAHWPTGIPVTRRGKLEAQPGQLVDIMATCLDLAGAQYPAEYRGQKIKPAEGVSLRPAFSGQPLVRTQPLVWEHEGNRAIRIENWKLVAMENQPWELYNLATDRTELHDLAAAQPARVKLMALAWDAWAARADVLPLGTWRGKAKGEATAGSPERRFALKAGDHLAGDKAPAIAGRAFTITAKFDTGAAKEGVLVAQGGSNRGYALYLADGKLHFRIRNGASVATASTAETVSGAHTAVARVDAKGAITLTLDGQSTAKANLPGLPSAMPQDGLDVGEDTNGAVGPYQTPNAFKGAIDSILIELDAP